MQTRNILDVRTIVAVVSLVALVSFVLWSIGFGLNSTQSLQNQVDNLIAQRNSLQTQVTSLQNQVASLNEQLGAKQVVIEDLQVQLRVYDKLIRRVYPDLTYSFSGGFLVP
jgi:peptidoglycan hydrolase CwlO-like protein